MPFTSPPPFPSSLRLRSTVHSFGSLLSLLLLLATLTTPTRPQRTPQKRNYDTHEHYVIEIIPSARSIDPHQIVSPLGVTFIERVGELEDFLLVSAPKSFVQEGFQLVRRDEGITRDAVLERFQWIKRSLEQPRYSGALDAFDRRRWSDVSKPAPLLSTRQVAKIIRSVDRQVLRRRVKRDVIYIPSPSGPIIKRSEEEDDKKRAASRTLSQRLGLQFGIKDPLWPKQWHLANDEMARHMINVTDVWASGITGKNVTVAIVDDGLDMNSDDLKPNFFEAGSWDYNDHTPLPEPRLPDDLHGTRCAGEIAAIRNDVCGVGVAYDAKVAGIRILSASISDADEASALNFGYQENHIYSCSWGPPDDGKSMEAPSRLIFKAMLNGIQKGRGGKGSVFVFASGNGGAVDDQCNFDGYTNSIYSITISAVDRKGLHPYYSEVCSANMVVTYSSGSGDNIHTTDVGKNKCTDRHGGTSAAAPLGAGIIALVLEARPDLTWRDVQHLAVATATPIQTADPDWQQTATGRWYNHKFGFGNMDATKIVEAAKTWKLVKPQAWWKSPNTNAGKQPTTKEGAKSVIWIKQADLDGANFEKLEHITVAVNIKHGRRGNVRVTLTSPHGTVSVLATHRRYDEDTAGFPGWVFMTVKHWGEPPVGNWTLTVLDPHQTPGKNGTFEDWALALWGECKDASIQKPFVMADAADITLPGTPVSGVAFGTEEIESQASTGPPGAVATPAPGLNPPPAVEGVGIEDQYRTKSIARPTDHLPEDHATSNMEDFVTGLGGLSSYISGERSSWVFAVFGTLIVVGGSVVGWMVLRRIRRRRRGIVGDEDGVGLLSSSRGNGYGFEPVAGEEDLPMRALDQGRRDGGRRKEAKGARTKELYDAFGEGSEEGDDDNGEVVPLVGGDQLDEEGVQRVESEGKGKGKAPEYRDD